VFLSVCLCARLTSAGVAIEQSNCSNVSRLRAEQTTSNPFDAVVDNRSTDDRRATCLYQSARPAVNVRQVFLVHVHMRFRLFSYLSWISAGLVLVVPSEGLPFLDSACSSSQRTLSVRSDRATTVFLAPAHAARRLRSLQRRRTDSSSLLVRSWTTRTTARVAANALSLRAVASHEDDAPSRRPSPGDSTRSFFQDHPCRFPLTSRSRRRRRTTARFAHGGNIDDQDLHVDRDVFCGNKTVTESQSPQRLHTLKGVERVYCLSDLHTDHAANLEWLRERMERPPPPGLTSPSPTTKAQATWSSKDLLVIAGDISHSLPLLEETLECMLEPGCQVLFVAGNHEAWRDHPVDRSNQEGGSPASKRGGGKASAESAFSSRQQSSSPSSSWSSLDKLDRVYETCRRLGVMVDPCFVPSIPQKSIRGRGSSHPSSLYIVPLQSWYDGTLSFAPDLEAGFEHWPWVDFSRCAWPADAFPLDRNRLPQNLVEHLLEGNLPALDTVLHHQLDQSTASSLSSTPSSSHPHAVMTVSHFLPNFQSLPDWRDLDATSFDLAWLDHGAGDMSAKFAKVAGSVKIVRAPNLTANTLCLRSLRHCIIP
jgi:Calcineurin-like phosphoesterase